MRAYGVANNGEVVFASYNVREAKKFAKSQWERSVNETAEEYGWDISNPTQHWNAAYQAGYDGDVFRVFSFDTDMFGEDDDEEIEIDTDDGELLISYGDVAFWLGQRVAGNR